MTIKLYSIFDTVAEQYGPLFQAANVDVANRSFKNLIERPENGVTDPSEYELHYIGEFDYESGDLEPAPDGAVFMRRGVKSEHQEISRRDRSVDSQGHEDGNSVIYAEEGQ